MAPQPPASKANTESEYILFHRSTSFAVGYERNGVLRWTIYPSDGPIWGAEEGHATARDRAGSFRVAVREAQAAIDAWLLQKAPTGREDRAP